MAKVFGGMAGNAEGKLRGRQTQIENAIDAAMGSNSSGGSNTAHEMISTAPAGTKVHMSNGAGGYSFDSTDKMQKRSAAKAARSDLENWIESGR